MFSIVDIENVVFSRVATALRASFDGVFVAGEYTETPSKFPAVTLTESSNTVIANRRTAQSIENGAAVLYEVNVYSNKTKGKKSEAKEIMALIDEQMASMGFTRTLLNPIPNVIDATIYRIVARYTAAVLPEGNDTYRVYAN